MDKKTLLLVILVFTLLFCACGSIDESRAVDGSLESDKAVFDYNLSVKVFVPLSDMDSLNRYHNDSEVDVWNDENTNGFVKADGQSELSIDFLGRTFTGKYVKTYSTYWQYENYLKNEYKTDNGSFAVKTDDNKLIYFTGARIRLFDHKINDIETINMFNEIADKYICRDNYEFNMVKNENLDEIDYSLYYIRPLNGIKTSERFSMGFSSEGTCSSLYYVMVDEFNDFYASYNKEEINEMTEKLTSDEAIKQLEAKLVSIYGEYDSYEIFDKTYTLLEDGSLALVCKVGIDPVYDETGKNVSQYYGTGVDYYEKGEAYIIICFANEE